MFLSFLIFIITLEYIVFYVLLSRKKIISMLCIFSKNFKKWQKREYMQLCNYL
ncbi:hypothetical protein C2G38_2104396 [Gigaspora rosea]|uniref:Uncharacterized protein n=1 Tax=Gigaspora rosea TaxID=44941 RepID=A0A397UNP9_9GLOM|nr:hypothetical protein C2G38_2104396 [Gigaspora rosea]